MVEVTNNLLLGNLFSVYQFVHHLIYLQDGVTALVAASREGHSQIVDSLLKAGAKPDLQANVRMDLL